MASRKIYLLDPQHLDPETIAVTFAKTSRSPLSFSDIAQELTKEKSAEFHEKWVVGYGHASVAEHAVLHIACENISRLAVEVLESNRLASYTEKSTRYQKWNPDEFLVPEELKNHTLHKEYLETCSMLLDVYEQCVGRVQPIIQEMNPRESGETDTAWEKRIRSKNVDVSRYLLPASSLANVGVTINARALEHAIQKMLSDKLMEVRSMGEEIKKTALHMIPTLVKYADIDPYLCQIEKEINNVFIQSKKESKTKDWMNLVDFDHNGEDAIIAGALFRYNKRSFRECSDWISNLNFEEKKSLTGMLFQGVDKHVSLLREFEFLSFVMEIVLDQGAYFELKRHRMMTLTAQSLTTDLGYAVPRLIEDAKFEEEYCRAMESAKRTFDHLQDGLPTIAAYVVPNAFNRRILLRMNLRSADHFLCMRSAPNAHFSLRRVAHRMAEEINKIAPMIGPQLRVSTVENWKQIENSYFSATARDI